MLHQRELPGAMGWTFYANSQRDPKKRSRPYTVEDFLVHKAPGGAKSPAAAIRIESPEDQKAKMRSYMAGIQRQLVDIGKVKQERRRAG